ncbi:MAG: two-component regulator propeller domain-containing protein, partial [Acidobacteriota bacterium]
MGLKRHFSVAAVAGLWAVEMLIPSSAECQWRPTRQFTVRDGLVQSQISEIAQDADGYLWVATQGGLCRFDGQTFRRFTREDGLPDNVVNGVDTLGSEAWIATDLAGIAHWDGTSFTNIPDLPLPEGEMLTGVRALSDGTILVTSNEGVLAYRNHHWTLIDDRPSWVLLKGTGDRSISIGHTPLSIDKDLKISPLIELKEEQNLLAAAENPDHTWIALQPHTLSLIQGSDVRWMTPDIDGEITTLLADESGSGLWIGTDQGLWRRHEDGVVEKMFIEPELPGDPFAVSDADTMIKYINANARMPQSI